MEGKTFHPKPASKKYNRFARHHDTVGCGVLTAWSWRQGSICLVCTVDPHKSVSLVSFLLERWICCREERWYGLRSYTQSWDLLRVLKVAEAWEIFLRPHSWDIVWIIPFTPYLMWSWVGLLVYVSRLDSMSILRKVICGNHMLKVNKNIS